MSQIVIDLPEDLAARLRESHVSDEILTHFLIEAIKAWLPAESDSSSSFSIKSNEAELRFSESAVTFTEQLIAENRSLFERLARLPHESD